MFITGNLLATPAVQTISGGPTSGYWNGDTKNVALFNSPMGLAFFSGSNSLAGDVLYVADRDNDAVRKLDLNLNQTITFLTSKISKPVGVAVDLSGNLYVLNRGNGNNGTVLEFNRYGNFLGTNALALTNANALARDDSGNLFVTVNGNAVVKIEPGSFPGVKTNVCTVTNANTVLRGITTLSSGLLAVCDAGRNGILTINPLTGAWTNLTGFNGVGDTFGAPGFVQFNQPLGISAAGAGMLVVTDNGNHRVKTVDASGNVCSLYGVCSTEWNVVPGDPSVLPGWWDGNGCPCQINCMVCDNYAEARLPVAITVAPDGSVYTTENFYHLIRQVVQTGLTGPENASAPTIVTQPQNQTANLGGTATFTVTASGLQPLSYQWQFGGSPLADGTASSYTRGNIQASDAGNYSVVVANAAGSVTSSNAALIVNLPPAITTHPQSQTIGAGDTASFYVLATGTAPLAYQWRLNGARIATATASSFTRTNAQPADAGNYSVVISNLAGSVTSSNAVLTIDTAPLITTQPQDQIVLLGSSAAFNVTAGGASPLTYQWQLSGVPLLGKTSTNLIFVSAQSSNVGPYTVVVTNPFGSVTSSVAQLSVLGPPTISPDTGYFPMGQTITVKSGLTNASLHYTADGTEPTLASPSVTMTTGGGGFVVGSIRWINPTNDLTALRVKAFDGTNTSATTSGIPATNNNVGIPSGPNTNILAGVGSTVVVPVVANLRSNDTVRSYIFRVEVAPGGGATMIPSQFRTLDVSSNDFINVVTSAQGSTPASINVQPYSIGTTRGLQISALGTNAGVSFTRFAVVALLAVPIPINAIPGQTYSIYVINSSATSDGGQATVAFPPMPAATILVTNVAYTVGDSAPGGWYNAGEFGNPYLDNADVNNAFYAAAGLRLPYPFTDVFNAMDTYPEDDLGFSGGDGEIRFLDWELIRLRALGLNTNNWVRAWSSGGQHTNALTSLVPGGSTNSGGGPVTAAPWNRQAKVAALPVGNAVAGNLVSVPVYVTTANAAPLAGLQFRGLITPDNGGPALASGPVFIPAVSLSPTFAQGFKPNELACGWKLNSFNFGSRSSNYLGALRFLMPPGALPGHTYTVSFANADGSPDLATQYAFESKQATVSVGVPAAPITDVTSDEWKLQFFGSLTATNANPNADPDHDGVPNWAEYIAGTDPTNAASRLMFNPTTTQMPGGQRQVVLSWLSAPGKLYEVQVASTPTGGSWSNLTTVSGAGAPVTALDINPSGPRYYRLRVLP